MCTGAVLGSSMRAVVCNNMRAVVGSSVRAAVGSSMHCNSCCTRPLSGIWMGMCPFSDLLLKYYAVCMCHAPVSCDNSHVSCVMCHVSCTHVSCVMCHVSCAMCNVSRAMCLSVCAHQESFIVLLGCHVHVSCVMCCPMLPC